MAHARLLVFVLLALAISGCQKAKYGREYGLSHADERISIRFEDAPFDVGVAAYLNTRSCRTINVTNKGGAPVMLDVFAFHLVKQGTFGGVSRELKLLVRDSPPPAQNALVAPLGENVLVIGNWPLRQLRIAPGVESSSCVDGFLDLSSEDIGLSLEWLEDAPTST